MATAKKITDHFLTCTICHEVFTDPSTLSCGHSFCGQCFVSYAKTRTDTISSQSIPCPLCRIPTRVSDTFRPVEEWEGQIRPTLLLKGLLDTVGPGTKDTANCNWCNDEGETSPAVSWCPVCDVSLCSNCLKAHRRSPSTKHHDVSEMTDDVKPKRRTKVKCQEHKEEFVTFCCKDCRRTLCQSCCILYHRKCESIVSLKSMLPEMRRALETRKETLMLQSTIEEKQLESLKSQTRELEENKSSVQSQIRSTAQRVIDNVKKKERELLDKLTEFTDKQMDQLKAQIKTGDIARNIYRHQAELIGQALSSEGEMDMYDLYQSSESETAESEGDVKKRGTRTRIEFSQDEDRLNRALSELPLGTIQVLDVFDPDTVGSPVLIHTVDCRSKEDQDKPLVFDIVSIKINGSDTLIVTDINNKCIKSFLKENNHQHHSRLNMNSSPIRITKLDDKNIAVTFSLSKQIAVVSLSPDLTLDSTIITQKQYVGLAALTPTTLAAGSASPPCVDIIDRIGNVMRSISPIHNGEKIIQKPFYLCTTRQGNILISDCETKSVVCVTPLGEVVFNFCPTGDRALRWPTGITSTATGHILLADFFRHKVIVLNETGELLKDLLTSEMGIFGPRGIDLEERGRIYITHILEDGDTVQVFTLE